MFSHDDIWIAIDRLANVSGYSTSGLAKKAGLDPTAFNRSKRMSPEGKPRWPSTESLSKILSVTNITMDEFIRYIHEEQSITLVTPTSAYAPYRQSIPVIGCAQAGQNGFFTDAGYPVGEGWDHVDLPAMAAIDETVYALKVSGDSMEPLYRDGDVLVVSPDAGIRRGDRVVVKTKDGQVMTKILSRKTTSKIELQSLNKNHDDLDFDMGDVDWIARVIWVSQ